MAQTRIAYQCGHSAVEQLYGSAAERTRRVDQAKARLCRECYRAAQTTSAAESTSDLPALVGSDKQVAWATEIRAKAVADIAALRAEFARRASGEQVATFDAAVASVLARTDARWWIDHRSDGARGLLRSATSS